MLGGTPRATVLGFFMPEKLKIDCFIDGYNLYHAIKDLRRPELKWLDLRKLSEQFVDSNTEILHKVFYFSAIATHRSKDSVKRHRSYVRALEARNVEVVLGKFKRKQLTCKRCKKSYSSHEEKMSDVNLATSMLISGFSGIRRMLLISGDSDFASTLEIIRGVGTTIRIIGPPGRPVSEELRRASGDSHVRKIKNVHLERCQLSDSIDCGSGRIVVRPKEWT